MLHQGRQIRGFIDKEDMWEEGVGGGGEMLHQGRQIRGFIDKEDRWGDVASRKTDKGIY